MFFSVIVPLHNKKPHIERALRSVYGQTHQDFELIVVDDASTDGGGEIANYIADARLRLVHRDRSGAGGYAARNLGVRLAAHSWIAFLDADDEWMPDFLKTISSLYCRLPDIRCFATAYERDYGNGKRVLCKYGKRYADESERRIGIAEYFRETRRDRCPLWTSAVVLDKSTLIAAGLFPEERCIRGGDVDTWLRVVELTDIGWSSRIGARYHRDAVNMVTGLIQPQLAHCVDFTIRDMARRRSLGGALSIVPEVALERVGNYYKKPAIKRLIRSFKITLADAKRLSFRADPFYVGGVYVAALMPKVILSATLRAVLSIKAALRRLVG